MTDRVKAITVILKKDTREDDIQSLVNSFLMFRNVSSVEPILVTHDDIINRSRIKAELVEAIYKTIETA